MFSAKESVSDEVWRERVRQLNSVSWKRARVHCASYKKDL